MLPSKYKIAVLNNGTGANVNVSVVGKPYKIDEATGKLVFGGEVTYASNASLANNASEIGSVINNDVDGQRYFGLHFQLAATPAATASGSVEVYLLEEDDSANDPDVQLGEPLASLQWDSASDAKRTSGEKN